MLTSGSLNSPCKSFASTCAKESFKKLIYFSCSNFPEMHFINCVLLVHGQNRTC